MWHNMIIRNTEYHLSSILSSLSGTKGELAVSQVFSKPESVNISCKKILSKTFPSHLASVDVKYDLYGYQAAARHF